MNLSKIFLKAGKLLAVKTIRKIRIKKRVPKSPHIINLDPEVKKWDKLNLILKARIRKLKNANAI